MAWPKFYTPLDCTTYEGYITKHMWLVGLFVAFFLILFCNLIAKKMLCTRHWCHVVDETTQISDWTDLQDCRQHHFYFVACREKHLWLFSSFFFISGVGVTLWSRKCLPPFVDAYAVDDMKNALTLTLTLKQDHFPDQNVIFGRSVCTSEWKTSKSIH